MSDNEQTETTQATDSESKTKSDVYRERNLLALAFIESVRRECESNSLPWRGGWWPDRDAVNDEAWAAVWFDDPHKGQFGWHIPLEMVPDWLDKRDPEYDGYTTADKYRRLQEGWISGLQRTDQED